jgi:phage gpG-like protein
MARRKAQQSKRIRIVGGEVRFTVSDPGAEEMVKALEFYNTQVSDFSPVFEAFAAYHRRSIARNFAAEGRPRRWAPLQPETIKDRLRQGYASGPILQRSGRLMRNFQITWRKTSYSVRNPLPYFNAHQFGYPAGNIPARPMLVLLAQDKAQFTRLARIHLGEG